MASRMQGGLVQRSSTDCMGMTFLSQGDRFDNKLICRFPTLGADTAEWQIRRDDRDIYAFYCARCMASLFGPFDCVNAQSRIDQSGCALQASGITDDKRQYVKVAW